MSGDWQTWTLYLHQPATAADPIFGNPIGFYLFSLPVYQSIFSWLTSLAVILLVATITCAVLAAVPQQPLIIDEKRPIISDFGKRGFSAVSIALGALLLFIAGQVFLSRYAYLWSDHASFSGVTYTEDNY